MMEVFNSLKKDIKDMLNRYLQVEGMKSELYNVPHNSTNRLIVSFDFEIPRNEHPEERVLTFLEQLKNSSLFDHYRNRISKLEKLDEKIGEIHSHITTGLTEDKLNSIKELKVENDKIRDNLRYSSKPSMDTIRRISKRSKKIDEILEKILEEK